MDEVLKLEEEELVELSKEIVGNTVLEHARVIKQWRRCQLEEVLRKEVEAEIEIDGQEEIQPKEEEEVVVPEATLLQQQQQEVETRNKLEQYRKEQEEAIGEDWREYLRKMIKQQLEQEEATKKQLNELPVPTDLNVPSDITLKTSYTNTSDDSSAKSEEATWFSLDDAATNYDVIGAASDFMRSVEEGINDFILGPVPQEKPRRRRKKKTKKKKEPEKPNPMTMLRSKFRC